MNPETLCFNPLRWLYGTGIVLFMGFFFGWLGGYLAWGREARYLRRLVEALRKTFPSIVRDALKN